MIGSPDRFLVGEQAALPAYAEGPAPKGCLGWLAWLWGWILRAGGRAQAESVRVLLPPPPGTYGYATLFTPHPEVIEESRQALGAYRTEYEQDDASSLYPWHVVIARHTGLPSLLRGFWDDQDSLDPQHIDESASQWLLQDQRARALFGIEADAAEPRLAYSDVNWVYVRPEGRPKGQISTPQVPGNAPVIDEQHPRMLTHPLTLAHARYRQMHGSRPVFGGQVVVHLNGRNRRACATSSYFPLDAEAEFSAEIDKATAEALAQQAVAGYLDDLEAIGLYQAILRPWMKAQAADQPAAGEWQPVHTRVAHKMIGGLALYSEQHDHVFSDLERLVAGGLPTARARLASLLREIGDQLVEHEPSEWNVQVVPYAGSERFIFPFAGDYHLAYQVELVSADTTQAWRVFVDAETGDVLGRPETCVLQKPKYYATAADVIAPALTEGTLTENPCKEFMAIGLYGDPDKPNQDPEPESWGHSKQKGSDFEATNVAIHAKRIYDHFVGTCGADADRLKKTPPGLRARVARLDPDPQLNMGFNHAQSIHPKLIIFQTDDHNGLVVEGKTVSHPTYDPEVIYHELTHGLQWLLNPHPFDDFTNSVPFGRALTEGYANYFGRSLAWRGDAQPPLWARAAYRGGDWGDRWDLTRDTDEDRLAAPNLYPHHKDTQGLDVYDVGMVWARALWDLRSSPEIALSADVIDRLALDGYNYVHGWVTSFEMAAEGVIHAAAELNIAFDEKAARKLFAKRGILADQSVQAMARAGDVVLAGADAGLMRSNIKGQDHSWEDWDDVPGQGEQRLTDVVALAVDGGIFYAATEVGIYRRASSDTNGGWAQVGTWPADQTPYCMAIAGGKIYVGTGHGVWFCEIAGGAAEWAVFECPDSQAGVKCSECSGSSTCACNFLALDQALGAVPSLNTDVLYTCRYDAIGYREAQPLNLTCADWLRQTIKDGSGEQAAVVSTTAQEPDTFYVGTLAHGIWEGVWEQNTLAGLTRLDSQKELGQRAILALALQDGRIIAGTTAGLYVGAADGGNVWTWKRRPGGGFPEKATVIRVLPIGDDVILASTATNGLWRLRNWVDDQNYVWEKVAGVESLDGTG